MKFSLLRTCALSLLSALAFFISNAHGGDLSRDFLTPPDPVKPSGCWWWLNGWVDKQAITRDMEEFRAKGMGSVLLVRSGQWSARTHPRKATGSMAIVSSPAIR